MRRDGGRAQVVIPRWVCQKRGRPALLAFAEGLRAQGLAVQRVTEDTARPGPDPLVCWGVEKTRFPQRRAFGALQTAQRRAGGALVILERGFIDRERFFYVGLDDLNGRGRQVHGEDVSDDRWSQLGARLHPWRSDGELIVIAGQVPRDTSCQHIDMRAWVREAAAVMRRRFPDAPVVFRPHPLRPRAIDPGRGVAVDRGPLAETLARTRLVVTFSSTAGVDAVLAGVPTLACDPMSMVWRLCPQGLEGEVARPDRAGWARWIAYCQWTLEEMAQGLPWRHLQGGPR